jgi:MinD-like ATPase involved in chromosome partitioning or flagellar assembly
MSTPPTTPVIAVWSHSGGVGRTSLALALAEAARRPGLRARVVSATKNSGDAGIYAEHGNLDVDITDLSGQAVADQRRTITGLSLKTHHDLLVVDCGLPYLDDFLARDLVADGAYGIGVADATTNAVTGYMQRTRDDLVEIAPVERLGFVLNRVPNDGTVMIGPILAAATKGADFAIAVGDARSGDRPSRSVLDVVLRRRATPPYDAIRSPLAAMSPAAEQLLVWAGVVDEDRQFA